MLDLVIIVSKPYAGVTQFMQKNGGIFEFSFQEIYEFYKETNSSLCDYDLDPELYLTDPQARSSLVGPCPIITVNSRLDKIVR